MQPIDRRTALLLGGLGVLSTAVGGWGLSRQWTSSSIDPRTGQTFTEPEVLTSSNGVLDVELTAASGQHEVAGRTVRTYGFNGGVPGPTLRVSPGDMLRIALTNDLDEATNLHVHGLHVSPADNGDNPFVKIEPGETFVYEHRLPEDHPPGTYWYHPHHHGMVADQLYRGLYGAIVVAEPTELPLTRERVMVVSDVKLDDSGVITPSVLEQMMGREGDLVLVNGQVAPTLTLRPGERERWRVVNACSSRFLDLTLDGHDVQLLGRDAGRLARPGPTGPLLAPGNRADLLVTGVEGTGDLVARPYDRGGMMAGMMRGPGGGPMGGDGAPVTLATVVAEGASVDPLPEIPATEPLRDLRDTDVVRRRLLTFEMGGMGAMMGGGMGMVRPARMPGPGGMGFTIDGREFDHSRIDQEVRLGTVEEWTIRNDSPMDHPFHLHVWPMQVTADPEPVSGEPVWLDVVNVPPLSQVTVRVPFEDFGGRTVYHCHILDHEDRGMMGVAVAR